MKKKEAREILEKYFQRHLPINDVIIYEEEVSEFKLNQYSFVWLLKKAYGLKEK